MESAAKAAAALSRHSGLVRLRAADNARTSDAAAEQELARLLGRPLSANAVDDTGWTDLHYAAALNLPRLATTLLAAGAGVAAATIKSDREPLGDRVQAVLLSFCCSGWLPGAWEDRFEKDCQGRADGAAPGGIVRTSCSGIRAVGGRRRVAIRTYGNALDLKPGVIATHPDILARASWPLAGAATPRPKQYDVDHQRRVTALVHRVIAGASARRRSPCGLRSLAASATGVRAQPAAVTRGLAGIFRERACTRSDY